MKKIKIAGVIICLLLIIGTALFFFFKFNTAGAFGDTVTFYGGSDSATINGKKVALDGEIIDINGCIYVASDKPLAALGFHLGWDKETRSVVAVKKGVTSYITVDSSSLIKGAQKYKMKNKTIIYKGVFYIPLDMFTRLTDAKVSTEGKVTRVYINRRDLMTDTVVGNAYRLSEDAIPYNGVYVSENFAMERVSIPESSAKDYAEIINKYGKILPSSVNIYNIIVPTSSEFYGPQNVYCDQTAGIKTVYANLSERIIPINAVRPLYEHAGEDIYFRTDHHWTQRGAYYVYEELMNIKGEIALPISDFPVKTGEYTGSFAGFTKGTEGEKIIKANPDRIEISSAPAFTAGASYNDMYMKSFNRTVSAVYQSTDSYMAFLGGDNPLTVLTGSAGNGKKAVVMKESFGNAFAPWLLNNYSEVYVIDLREFNDAGEPFKIKEFYDFIKFDDLIIINYPVSVASGTIRTHLLNFI
jgi:hypothetical protein